MGDSQPDHSHPMSMSSMPGAEHAGHKMAMTGALGPYPMTREVLGHGVAAGHVRALWACTS